MEIAYARSSSLGTLEYCEHKYFLIYNLGLQETPNIKTVKGTIVHKVLEMLAVAKKYHQDNPSEQFFTLKDCDSEYIVDFNKFLTKRELSEKEVDDVNKSRINKSIYVDKPFIEYGHSRLGEEIVADIIDIAYKYYSSRYPEYEWGRVDKRDCENFTWMALDTNDGMYDPRKARIVQPENSFVIPIDLPWAYYFDENGEAKQFAIKGTIDLITQVDDNTYEVVDWKGLPVDTPIPVESGWSTMGDLKVGDTLFDENGNKTRVLAKSEASLKPCYKITFDDGVEVVCDNEHLWKLSNGIVMSVVELEVGATIKVLKNIDSNKHKVPRTKLKVRTITKIELIESRVTQCIMVDSPTSTYLCTKNMIPTHNTGSRKNWSTNTEKSFDILCKDKQLMLYYYAARKLFPDKQIIFTIFFIRDGGPFSLCFDDIDLLKVEAFLEKHFLSVRENSLPKMRDPFQKDFQCKTLCHFYKNKQPGTNLNICKYIHNELRFNPMSEVIEKYKDPNFVIDRYQNPGE